MKPSRIPELDGLRGIAILLVVCIHYVNGQGSTGGPITTSFQKVMALGWSGVDLFFVLSGFLIGGILLDARGAPNYLKTFYARRFCRIIPIYYVWLLLYVLLTSFAGHFVQMHSNRGLQEMTGLPVYIHFLFLQNVWPITYFGLGGAWLIQLWSLAVEEQFYLICPWMIRLLSYRRLYIILFVVIASTPLLRLGLLGVAHVKPSWIYISMPCRADALATGILVAMIWREDRFRERLANHERAFIIVRAVLGLGVFCLLVWWPNENNFLTQTVGYTWLALFFAACLVSVLLWPTGLTARCLRISWLRSFGIVSYCMYLTHQAINAVCHSVLLKSPPRMSTPASASVTLLAGLVTYGIALLSWNFFERPFLEFGHRFKYDSPRETIAVHDLSKENAIGVVEE